MKQKKYNLTLVILSAEQITKAKEVNGQRMRITHALVCGPYGQIFGTEKQCLKYFSAWDPNHKTEILPGKWRAIFPSLFDKAVKADNFDIKNYESTHELVTELIRLEDKAGSNG